MNLGERKFVMDWASRKMTKGETVTTPKGPANVSEVKGSGITLTLLWPRNDEQFTMHVEDFGREQGLL